MKPLDCTDIKAMLSGLLDDELDAETRHRAERHLSECAACRAMVDEAEELSSLVAIDAGGLGVSFLPDAFEKQVLNRTVYASAYHIAGRQWTSWLGWVAAAASLMLAVSIWVLDRQSVLQPPQPPLDGASLAAKPNPNAYPVAGIGGRSWTYEGGLSAEAFRASTASLKTGAADVVNAMHVDDETYRAIDAQLALLQPSDERRNALEELGEQAALSRADADTLHAASLLLEMLAEADLTSFADVERIRQIAEYDDIVSRLAATRSRLQPADRAVVLAAESILLRIVKGPLNIADVKLIHDTVVTMDLSTEINDLSASRDRSPSL